MKIVLLKNVQNLGKMSDIKEVNDGYARNFLIPKGLASQVGKHGASVIEAQKRKSIRIKHELEIKKSRLAKKIDGQTITIAAKADETGTLYAKLDKHEIVEALNKDGYNFTVSEICFKNPIKKLGDYNIEVRLSDARAMIKLSIINE